MTHLLWDPMVKKGGATVFVSSVCRWHRTFGELFEMTMSALYLYFCSRPMFSFEIFSDKSLEDNITVHIVATKCEEPHLVVSVGENKKFRECDFVSSSSSASATRLLSSSNKVCKFQCYCRCSCKQLNVDAGGFWKNDISICEVYMQVG